MKFGSKMKGATFIEIDYALWWKKSGALLNKLIPFARVTARSVATKVLERVEYHTPETWEGRTDIKDLWEMSHKKLKTREEFIIKNLYPDQQIIIWFEEGTKAHDIYPKNSPWLHFNLRGTDKWIRTDHVSHPGTVAHEMIGKSEREMQPVIDSYVRKTFAQAQKIMDMGR